VTLVNQQLVAELMTRIQLAADACGLVLREPSPRWNPAEISVALDFRLPGVTAPSPPKPAWDGAAQADWNAKCSRYGLEPSDFQRVITTRSGKSFRLVSIHTNRPKYPISGIEITSHQIYKLREVDVARACREQRQQQP
jgi:hypothetical protein